MSDRRIADHLANERTLLAWIRTSLALMAFGVAIGRISAIGVDVGSDADAMRAQIVGAAIVLIGGAFSLAGARRAQAFRRRIDPDNDIPVGVAPLMTAVVSGLVSLAVAGWLIFA